MLGSIEMLDLNRMACAQFLCAIMFHVNNENDEALVRYKSMRARGRESK